MALTYTEIENGEQGSSVRGKINNFNNSSVIDVNKNTTDISNLSTRTTNVETKSNTNETNIAANLVKITDNTTGLTTKLNNPVNILTGTSFVNQIPAAADTALQIEFGAAQTTTDISLDALGSVTFNTAGIYNINFRVNIGRGSNTGAAIMFGRMLKNGVETGSSILFKIDSSNFVEPYTTSNIIDIAIGDIITVEIMIDSTGVLDGGLYTETPTNVAWSAVPSALLNIQKI